MSNYVIITDNTCDLPENILTENNIRILCLPYDVDGHEYTDSDSLSLKDFYVKMRAGSVTRTSQIAPDKFEQAFEEIVKKGINILYISFSSGLSGTYNSARIAAQSVNDKYLNQKVIVIDSLCASLGEGLLVYYAIQLKKEGKSIEEVAEWLEGNKLHLCHYFTVDDLMFLHRGGRVSKTSAIAGSILGIKPVLHVDNEGKLIPIGKVRGRRQSLVTIVDKMGEKMGDFENKTIAVCHGDCLEDAQFVANLVKQKYGVKNAIINYIGPVIGSHAGPGTISLFFMGKER